MKYYIIITAVICTFYSCITTKSTYIAPKQPQKKAVENIRNKNNETLKPKIEESHVNNTKITRKTTANLYENNNLLLLLPFNTNKLDINKLNNLSQFKDSSIAIDFYRGFKLALDKSKNNISLNIKVFDTNENKNDIKSILNTKQLKDTKFIVGPLFSSETDETIKILNNKRASSYLISPLDNRSLNNDTYNNFISINPPIYIHAEKLAQFALDSYKPKHIYYISIDGYDKNNTDNESFIYSFINYILTNSPSTIIENVIIKNGDTEKNVELLNQTFKKNEENILFMPYNNADSWYIIMRTLNNIDPLNKIVTLAHPHLIRFYRNLDVVKLQTYNTYLTSSSFIDVDKDSVIDFFNDYRKIYYSVASKYALSGYDLGNYLINISSLNNMNEILNYQYKGLLNNINLEETEYGLVNESLRILSITTKGPVVFKSY